MEKAQTHWLWKVLYREKMKLLLMIAIVWKPANEFNDTFTTTATHSRSALAWMVCLLGWWCFHSAILSSCAHSISFTSRSQLPNEWKDSGENWNENNNDEEGAGREDEWVVITDDNHLPVSLWPISAIYRLIVWISFYHPVDEQHSYKIPNSIPWKWFTYGWN